MLLFTIVLHKAMSQTKRVQIAPSQPVPFGDLFSTYSRERIPSWVSHTLVKEMQSCFLTWQSCEWETEGAYHAASSGVAPPCCLLSDGYTSSSSTTISWRYREVPTWHWVPTFKISQGVIWNWWSQQLTGIPVTKKILGDFLELFFERSPFLTTEPHTSTHLPAAGEVQLLILSHQSGRKSFLDYLPFKPQDFLFPEFSASFMA